ncbi:MAG: hypothetical protein FJZ58_03685 [Chlamydiae bacterium]|nr:hypothetical protein [Chlamydiota bacterium]
MGGFIPSDASRSDNTPPVPITGPGITGPQQPTPVDVSMMAVLLNGTYDLTGSFDTQNDNADVNQDALFEPDSLDATIQGGGNDNDDANGGGNNNNENNENEPPPDSGAPVESTTPNQGKATSTTFLQIQGGPAAAAMEALTSELSALTIAQNDMTKMKQFSSQQMYSAAQGQANAQINAADAEANTYKLQATSSFIQAGTAAAGVTAGMGVGYFNPTNQAKNELADAKSQSAGVNLTNRAITDPTVGTTNLPKPPTTAEYNKAATPSSDDFKPNTSSPRLSEESDRSTIPTPPPTDTEDTEMTDVSTWASRSSDATDRSTISSDRSSSLSSEEETEPTTDQEDMDIQHLAKYGTLPTHDTAGNLRDYTSEGGEHTYTNNLFDKMTNPEKANFGTSQRRFTYCQNHFENHDSIPSTDQDGNAISPEDQKRLTGLLLNKTYPGDDIAQKNCIQRMTDSQYMVKYGTLPSRNPDGSIRNYDNNPDTNLPGTTPSTNESEYKANLVKRLPDEQQTAYQASSKQFDYQRKYFQEHGYLPTKTKESSPGANDGTPINYTPDDQETLTRTMLDKMSPAERTAFTGKMPAYLEASNVNVKAANDQINNITTQRERSTQMWTQAFTALGGICTGAVNILIAQQKQDEGGFNAQATMFKTSYDMINGQFQGICQQSTSIASEILSAIEAFASTAAAQRN